MVNEAQRALSLTLSNLTGEGIGKIEDAASSSPLSHPVGEGQGEGSCFHCGELIPAGVRIHARLKIRQAAVCCEGCRAVAEFIAGVGLEDYYRYRSEPAARPNDQHDDWAIYEQAELLQQYTRAETHGCRSTVLLLEGMRCAACAWLIDKALRATPGICEVSINAATAHARITWSEADVSFRTVLRDIARLGYRPLPLSAEAVQTATQNERRVALKRLAVSGLGMMQVMMFAVATYTAQGDMDATLQHYFRVVSLLVTTPVLFYAGWPFFRSAGNALRLRSVNMDVPVTIALVLAYGASVWNTMRNRGDVYFDSVTMFIFFLTVGRYIEMLVRHRTGSVTEALARLLPRTAHRLHDARVEDLRNARIEDVPANQLIVGDEVLVRIGETIPADGHVTSGTTACEEALLTGESAPVPRSVGDKVIAGTLNVQAPFTLRISAVGQDTVLSGIVALLNRAQADKPRMARAADRAATWFLRRVLVGAVLVGAAWSWFDPSRAFDALLAVLVVTCPCALSLATPAVIAAATSALARRGLLVAHADAIEGLAGIERILFDKTGTLTQGHISVERCHLLAQHSEAYCFAIAAALEQAAEHPIAAAFKDKTNTTCTAEAVRVVIGQGVEGRIAGDLYRIGTPEFVNGLCSNAQHIIDSSAILLGNNAGLIAAFSLGDALRNEAAEVVTALKKLGVHSEIVSGDASETVRAVALQTGITSYHARLTPEAKLTRLHTLIAAKQHIAMIGDGVNDAPTLRAAPVSIAMGSGSALAQANADLVLMSSSLRSLPEAIVIARRAQAIVRQNLTWAALYNLCALPIAAFGLIPPWLAAIGMSVSSIVVVLNALRLLPRHGNSANYRLPSNPLSRSTGDDRKDAGGRATPGAIAEGQGEGSWSPHDTPAITP